MDRDSVRFNKSNPKGFSSKLGKKFAKKPMKKVDFAHSRKPLGFMSKFLKSFQTVSEHLEKCNSV